MRNLFFFFCLTLALPIFAQEQSSLSHQEIEQRAFEVEGYLMSPFCPGRLLRDCPSSGAHDLKIEIREAVATGEDPQIVRDLLIDKYGEDIRAAPLAQGFGLLAWITPFIFLLFGTLLFFFVVRPKGKSEVKNTKTPDEPLSKEALARIEEELKD